MTTPRWERFEIALEGSTEGNPFVDVALSAEFTFGNRRLTVDGFYDGDGVWRVRFAPDTEGEWRYRTHSDCPALDGHAGAFVCSPARDGAHGPVRVADSGRFAYADGAPYHCVGTTCYAWIHQPDALQEETLHTLASSPFNKLRMCLFPKRYAYNRNEPERFPFVRGDDGAFDLRRFDLDYWRRLERRLTQMASLGIEADLILFHPYDEGWWGFDRMDADSDDFYVRYAIARLAAHGNVWWSLANEFDFMGRKVAADWERYFRLIQERDPYPRLRSIHNGSRWYDHTKPWVTHASLQSSDMTAGIRFRELYGKPVVYDECCYEGNIEWLWGNLTAEAMVQRFWDGFVRGCSVGHGETYLHPEEILWWSKGGALHGQSPVRIAFLKSVLEDAPAAAAPLTDLFGWEHNGIGALGVPGRYYLIYFGSHRPARKEIPLPDEADFRIEVLDTWAMTVDPLPGVFRGRSRVPLPGKPYVALRITRDGP